MPQGRYSEADIQQASAQRGQYSEADVLPEQSLGAGLTEYGHQMGGFFEGLWNKAKGAVGALLPDNPSKAAVEAPIRVLAGAADALHSHIKNLQGLQDKAEQSLAKGDIADFLGHMQALSVEGIVPGIGQAADAAKAKWDAGDKVGATADAAALTSQALLGAKSGDLVKGALNAGAYTVAGARAAAPGVIGGMAKAGVGEVLAKIPGMELPARFGLQYPAIRQVAKALEKGAAAGRAAIAPEAAAATEAAIPRPVRASQARAATAPPAEVPPSAPGKTAADLLNEEMGTKEATPATAEPTLDGGTTVQDIGKGLGIKDWKDATPQDKAMAQGVFDRLKAAEEGAPAAAEAPKAYAPRPPEYYGVKPAEVPPTPPPPSAPAPAQPASAAPPAAKVQPIRPAPPTEAEDIDFQQRYGEQEQPEVAKFLGHEQSAPPQPKPASGATAAKSARYADAIASWAKDMGMSPKAIADQWGSTTPEVRGQIILQLKQKGYLGANETIPRTSAQGIVDALKAKAATIKPPAGFSMGSMKQYPPEAASPAPTAIDSKAAIPQTAEVMQSTPTQEAAAPKPAFQYKGFLATLGDAERENLFSVMREYGNKAMKYAEQHAQLRPKYGEIAVGGAHMDPLINQYGIEAVGRELGRGATIEDAIAAGKQEAQMTAQKFNARVKGNAMAYQIHRPEGMANSMLDEYGRRLRAALK